MSEPRHAPHNAQSRYEIVTKERLTQVLEGTYGDVSGNSVEPHQLAVLFAVMAIGAHHNLELPPNDPSAEQYCNAARDCLMIGRFLSKSSLAGCQALNLMAHYDLATDVGRDGDGAWSLWGMSARMGHAMGLHRDGQSWNLKETVLEERRQVFWECRSAELFQANCFSRPPSISAEYLDTRLPTTITPFHRFKFDLSQVSDLWVPSLMWLGLKSVCSPRFFRCEPNRTRTYSASQRSCELLHDCRPNSSLALERQTPFQLRCRTAMLSLPSIYPDLDGARRASPPTNKRDLRTTLEQYFLALLVAETLINLHRAHYARAIATNQTDPTKSPYGNSYLTVVERCSVSAHMLGYHAKLMAGGDTARDGAV